MHTVGREIGRETLENLKNEKYTLQDLDYGEKTEKTCKMRQKHCRNWNMARNTENGENEKCTLQNLEYREKTENQGK